MHGNFPNLSINMQSSLSTFILHKKKREQKHSTSFTLEPPTFSFLHFPVLNYTYFTCHLAYANNSAKNLTNEQKSVGLVDSEIPYSLD